MGAPDNAAGTHAQPRERSDSAANVRWRDRAASILVVEDEDAICGLFRHALSAAGYLVQTVSSVSDALGALSVDTFDLAFFDIHLPDGNGLILLETCLSTHPDLPIVMITGQADVVVAAQAIRAGACDFISKPFPLASLPIIVERNVTRNEVAEARRKTHRRQLQNSYETVLSALLTALDTRDTETEGHSERVTGYTMVLAEALGVSEEEMYHIERGALLHDIGKIGVPDRILHKPGPLSREEWEEMRRHPIIGHSMCARIEFLQGAGEIILHHHERWDGTGYPDRQKGERIPFGARIFAVVDAFDAMTTDRSYRKAKSYEEAALEIRSCSGTQFDPAVVNAFLGIPESRWADVRARIKRCHDLDDRRLRAESKYNSLPQILWVETDGVARVRNVA